MITGITKKLLIIGGVMGISALATPSDAAFFLPFLAVALGAMVGTAAVVVGAGAAMGVCPSYIPGCESSDPQTLANAMQKALADTSDELVPCLSCQIVYAFLYIGDTVAKSVYHFIAEGLDTFFNIMFALYVAFQFIRVATPGLEMGRAEPFKRILVASVFFIFVSYFFTIDGQQQFFVWFYEGILIDGINSMNAVIVDTMAQLQDPYLKLPSGWTFTGLLSHSSTGISGATGGALTNLDQSVIQGLMKAIYMAQRVMYFGIIIGSFQIDMAVAQASSSIAGIVPAFFNALAGFVLILLFGYGIITFGFAMIDLIIRICVIFAIMPILLMGLVFPFMRKWFITGALGILQVGVGLLMSAVLFSIAGMVLQFIPKMIPKEAGTSPATHANWAEFAESLSGMGSGAEHVTTLSFLHPWFWMIVIAGMFVLGALRRGQALAKEIVGGMDGSAASSVGSTAGAAVGAVATAPALIAGGLAVKKVAGKASAAGAALKNKFKTAGGGRHSGAVDDATQE